MRGGIIKGGVREVITSKVEFNEDILSKKIFDEEGRVYALKAPKNS